jgi:hypothetical protein
MIIKNATVYHSDAGNCPECGAQFLFDPRASYAGAFVETTQFAAVILKCDNDQCHNTTTMHIRLAEDVQSSVLPQVITANEAAKLYNRDMSTIRRACINGWIPARKSGRVWLMLRSDAESRWGQSCT